MSTAPAPQPVAPPALEIDDLWVTYGSVPAVRSLSLTIAPGEIVGLIGPNGAGKSTTLHAIVGLVPARDGHIRVQGRRLARPVRPDQADDLTRPDLEREVVHGLDRAVADGQPFDDERCTGHPAASSSWTALSPR